MPKPCKLELNNSGAWKVIVHFDAADDERADAVMNAAADLANAANDGLKKPQLTLRISSNESPPVVLMHYEGIEGGWRDARTGAPC